MGERRQLELFAQLKKNDLAAQILRNLCIAVVCLTVI